MNKHIVLAAILLTPLPAFASSGFDGTWKTDISSLQLPAKPQVFSLKHGVFTCKTCVPAYSVKADGADHPVKGHPYFDTAAIKVVDANTVEEIDKKGGKVVTDATSAVSPDGKTTTYTFTDSSDTNAAPVTGKGIMTRVGPAPKGAHAISGSWQMQNVANLSDNNLLTTFKSTGDSMTMTTPTGQSYTAKTDGTETAYKGDPGITSVTLKQTAPNTLVETDKRAGKTIGIATMTLAADGKTMTVAYEDKLRGTTTTATAKKQ
jgi:hypothetical protein